MGRDRQRNEGIVQRDGQGCVERLRGLGDPNVPLSIPTGVQLAPTSPKLMEGSFCDVRRQKVSKVSQSPDFVCWCTYTRLTQEYGAFVTWPADVT
jgi:hypothetical protein